MAASLLSRRPRQVARDCRHQQGERHAGVSAPFDDRRTGNTCHCAILIRYVARSNRKFSIYLNWKKSYHRGAKREPLRPLGCTGVSRLNDQELRTLEEPRIRFRLDLAKRGRR